ncbi:hypothetical protein VPH35_100570 [Triticum aestivum]|uniref:Uncharacterized protein n=1 Tax=Aegilops tauschii TaxID=37682 RepID=R7W4L7_AEGTA
MAASLNCISCSANSFEELCDLRRNYSLANRIVVVGIKRHMIVLGFCFYTFLGPNVYMRCRSKENAVSLGRSIHSILETITFFEARIASTQGALAGVGLSIGYPLEHHLQGSL